VSVKLEITVPRRIYEILEKKARQQGLKVSDYVLLAIARVAEEG